MQRRNSVRQTTGHNSILNKKFCIVTPPLGNCFYSKIGTDNVISSALHLLKLKLYFGIESILVAGRCDTVSSQVGSEILRVA